jgi:hypothetical protein
MERQAELCPGRRMMLFLLALLAFTGCHRNDESPRSTVFEVPRKSASTPLDSIAGSYVRLALALGERDADSLDFSTAPEEVRAEVHRSYPPLDAIDAEAAKLSGQLHSLNLPADQHQRAESLALQLASIEARTAMLRGKFLDFDSEAHVLFATARIPDTQLAERSAVLARVAALLPAQHGRSDLSPASRYAAYDRHFLVPPERLAAVMTAALKSCRQQTLTYLALPANESVDLTFVRNQPWSAFSRYRGHAHSTIQLNLDLPITVDDALELACHEGYPGHHVFNTLRDAALVQQQGWPEAQVQLTFSPQSYVSEAAAAYAPRMAFSTAERFQVERDTLFPLAGLSKSEAERYVTISSLVRELSSAEPAIAREYLDGRLEFVRAGQQLATQMLMAHADASLLYLNEYRSYMLAYTDGAERVSALVDTRPRAALHHLSVETEERRRARWQRYEGLMRDPQFTLATMEHSPRSVSSVTRDATSFGMENRPRQSQANIHNAVVLPD